MKKISLQLRLTLLSCILLAIACMTLTLVLNLSATKMITPQRIIPAYSTDMSIPMTRIVPATSHQLFKVESILAMSCIILFGSSITFLLVGQALKPIKRLTYSCTNKKIDTLTETIPLPSMHDEIYDLTQAFNSMSKHLEHSFQLQKYFSAAVAHELRTPLASMQTQLDVDSLAHPENQQRNSHLIKQIQRLSTLVDDLLLFHNEAPLTNLTQTPLHLLCQDLKEELLPMATEKNITLRISDTPFFITGSDRLLERVFYNLLHNGIHHGLNGTSVGIDFFPETQTIHVWNEGITIADKDKPFIFRPFYQAPSTSNNKQKGNGLGLAICKKILSQHSGSITVHDAPPNGTVFIVRFQKNIQKK